PPRRRHAGRGVASRRDAQRDAGTYRGRRSPRAAFRRRCKPSTAHASRAADHRARAGARPCPLVRRAAGRALVRRGEHGPPLAPGRQPAAARARRRRPHTVEGRRNRCRRPSRAGRAAFRHPRRGRAARRQRGSAPARAGSDEHGRQRAASRRRRRDAHGCAAQRQRGAPRAGQGLRLSAGVPRARLRPFQSCRYLSAGGQRPRARNRRDDRTGARRRSTRREPPRRGRRCVGRTPPAQCEITAGGVAITTEEALMSAEAQTVVLIHGMWMTPRSWDDWVDHYRSRGCSAIAPGWPGVKDPEETRRDPTALRGLRLTQIADHYEPIIRELDRPPIIIGHSFGGLTTQLLLNRGLGAAGVAIGTAPPKGILLLPPSTLRSAFPALKNPFDRDGLSPLSLKQFQYRFTNTLSEAESKRIYDEQYIPGTNHAFFDALG